MKRAIVTIGNFDGVHLGHLKLIRRVVERAHARELSSFAITFDPHPDQVLFPESKQVYLSTAEERAELLRGAGIDSVWICPFTRDLARLEPEDFIHMVSERQPIAELWIGADFAMGRNRKGSIAVLAELGAASGWDLHMVAPQMFEGQVVSSTAVRTLLAAGAVRGAADLLGRSYRVPGEIEGDSLLVDARRALPKSGITYDVHLYQDQSVFEGAATVEQDPPRVTVDPRIPHHAGSARVDFVRRAD
jgi:riboflavin kinase/FMN adenylyltransferase